MSARSSSRFGGPVIESMTGLLRGAHIAVQRCHHDVAHYVGGAAIVGPRLVSEPARSARQSRLARIETKLDRVLFDHVDHEKRVRKVDTRMAVWSEAGSAVVTAPRRCRSACRRSTPRTPSERHRPVHQARGLALPIALFSLARRGVNQSLDPPVLDGTRFAPAYNASMPAA